jgi:septal ring factor EnvC (AmiA/AmiB activator)
MIKTILIFISVFIVSTAVAQSGSDKEQQELERERQELKNEIQEKQDLLEKNKQNTRQSLSDLAKINSKLDLQERVINNLNRQVNLLDNNITKSQRDVHRLGLLLDTLKLEYEKSMIYSYKNRSNSDFLNFIFSASSFNDAIKRITYLKSYRSYREMQGENIIKTEQLQRQRINELSDNKQKKNTVLQTQSKEIDVLADQQKERSQIVLKLKAQGKELNNEIAAKKKQMQKVGNVLAAAIKRARQDAIAKAKADAEKARKDEQNNLITNHTSSVSVKPANKPITPAIAPKQDLLPTAADVKLNANFIGNRGSLPWPIDKGYIIMHFGLNELPNGVKVDNPGITIGGDIGASVKAIFDGEVTAVSNIDDMQMVVLKHGAYFSAYSNLTNVNLTKGQTVHTGEVIGKVAQNDEGNGSIDLIISSEKDNMNPESWLRRK